MRIVLTGAAGFVGRHLARALQAVGHEVCGTDLPSLAPDAAFALDLRDRAAVIDALAQWHPDLVVHAGAISGAMLAQDDPALMFDVNVNGTLSVLEAMRRAGVARLVHLSSNAVYRDRADRDPLPEDAPLGSDEPYGASKVAAEAVVTAYAASAGIDAWMLRISSIYGPGRRTPYLFSALAEAARTGVPVRLTDESTNMRQFVHVSDVVAGTLAAVQRVAGGCVAVNVTGGEYLSEAALARLVQRHLPALRVEVVADTGTHGDGRKGPLDLTRALRLLGWQPRVGIVQGLDSLF